MTLRSRALGEQFLTWIGRATIVAMLVLTCAPLDVAAAGGRSVDRAGDTLVRAATAVTLNVPATANIFGAGRAAPPTGPGGAGTSPPGYVLPSGELRVLTFSSVSGRVTCCNTQSPAVYNGPEGRADFSTRLDGVGGISGVQSSRAMFLAGVFLGERPPSGSTATRTGTHAPAIGQVFYIGTGHSAGKQVEFEVPDGATRLFLGIADGYSFVGQPSYYGDNAGSFAVAFAVTSPISAGQPVPIARVSNGCGGAGWDSLVAAQNYLGNTSVYRNSNINPTARAFTVNFKDACDLHDACYSGAMVKDKLSGGVKSFRTFSRHECDTKFFTDMRRICDRRIPPAFKVALTNCRATGGNASFGARSRYNFVNRWGHLFFDADPAKPGTQSTGTRAN